MIKAIIFDLNGVFIQSPKLSERFKEDFDVPTEEFLPALKEIMSKVRQPNAGDSYPLWQPYLVKWNINMNEDEFFKYWFEAEKEVPELVQYAENLKNKGIRLFVLSNNFSERAKYYSENFPFLAKLFEKVYYSWQTGFVKPDPKAFELILKKNDLQGAECLFFDDSEANIEAAKSVGIIGLPYENNEQLMGEVSSRVGNS